MGRGEFVDDHLQSNEMTEISRLKRIVETLRSENGCSWDKVQTHSSLKAACTEDALWSIKSVFLWKVLR
ncbi:hypothetical protein [Butyrivibrio sp. WCE2006]|uniref:hypothetical protein n=1 Tax=Butyrivibrio sp. WCE2006 TaxID=1410611 RepID=UPI0012DE8161